MLGDRVFGVTAKTRSCITHQTLSIPYFECFFIFSVYGMWMLKKQNIESNKSRFDWKHLKGIKSVTVYDM